MAETTDSLAGIEYHGIAGSSFDCTEAVARLLLSEDPPTRARILSAGGIHCLLLTKKCGDLIAIKSGFTSGYGGTGPSCFSLTLQMLDTHNCQIDECDADKETIERLDVSALTTTDLERIETSPPIRPSRWAKYVYESHITSAHDGRLWEQFNPTMPFALIDNRLFELARDFQNNPENCLLKGYRQLEDLVRQRTNTRDYGQKLFAKTFQGQSSLLYWKGIDEGEQTGRANLFIGTFLAHRNPRAHRELQDNGKSLLSEFLLLNHLFRLEREAVAREPLE